MEYYLRSPSSESPGADFTKIGTKRVTRPNQKVSHFESDFLLLLAFPARVLVFCFVWVVFFVPPPLEVFPTQSLYLPAARPGFSVICLVFLHLCILITTIVVLTFLQIFDVQFFNVFFSSCLMANRMKLNETRFHNSMYSHRPTLIMMTQPL